MRISSRLSFISVVVAGGWDFCVFVLVPIDYTCDGVGFGDWACGSGVQEA